jgi:hypothetical protein
MPEKDPGAGGMHHGDEVADVTLPTGDEPMEVMKPSEEAFDVPAATGASEVPAILCDLATSATLRGAHLDAIGGHQGFVQRVAVVVAVADQPRREVCEEAGGRAPAASTAAVIDAALRA